MCCGTGRDWVITRGRATSSACAKAVVERHRGEFPSEEAQLAALPGIGTYTAAAIAAIAFEARTAAIDADGERVLARLFAVEAELPAAKAREFAASPRDCSRRHAPAISPRR